MKESRDVAGFAEGNMPPLRFRSRVRRTPHRAPGIWCPAGASLRDWRSFEAMIIIQSIDLKNRYRFLAEEMPPQFEVNSLNFNLVAL